MKMGYSAYSTSTYSYYFDINRSALRHSHALLARCQSRKRAAVSGEGTMQVSDRPQIR